METNFDFKSSLCTSREQSERLLALGLKKETADMCWTKMARISGTFYVPELAPINMVSWRHTPAWSLHRLIEMMPKNIAIDGDTAYPLQIQKRSDGKWCVGYQGWYDCVGDLYDSVIWIYQLLISEGYLDEFRNKG